MKFNEEDIKAYSENIKKIEEFSVNIVSEMSCQESLGGMEDMRKSILNAISNLLSLSLLSSDHVFKLEDSELFTVLANATAKGIFRKTGIFDISIEEFKKIIDNYCEELKIICLSMAGSVIADYESAGKEKGRAEFERILNKVEKNKLTNEKCKDD